MRRSRPIVLALSVLSLALGVLLGGLAQAGEAAPAATAACKSYARLLGSPSCHGTATVKIAGKVSRYKDVECLIDKKANTPREVFKERAFVLLMIIAQKHFRSSGASLLALGTKGAVQRPVTVTLAAKNRHSGSFTGKARAGLPAVSGSFTCK